ncbi:TBC1 domain family member 12 [Porphyridium purpureum]|uniref:TBC1 domain family member 12 n=1 Tax=Porphyridium purpureum TaxID=35688 RepID=A0A5J4Z5W5_PORPP|nr:TBC1 domain family member 12 [Porphyridium purpureum]|eukprot:POR7253..scf295_1
MDRVIRRESAENSAKRSACKLVSINVRISTNMYNSQQGDETPQQQQRVGSNSMASAAASGLPSSLAAAIVQPTAWIKSTSLSLLSHSPHGAVHKSSSLLDAMVNEDLSMLDGSMYVQSIEKSDSQGSSPSAKLSYANSAEFSSQLLTRNRFYEWLESETHIDLDKLRLAARYGIPDDVRGDVWKYLLGVSKSEKSDELYQKNRNTARYRERLRGVDESDEVSRRVMGEARRQWQSRVSDDSRAVQQRPFLGHLEIRQTAASEKGDRNTTPPEFEVRARLEKSSDHEGGSSTLEHCSSRASDSTRTPTSEQSSRTFSRELSESEIFQQATATVRGATEDDASRASTKASEAASARASTFSDGKNSAKANELNQRKTDNRAIASLVLDTKAGTDENLRVYARVISATLNSLGPEYVYCAELVSMLTPFLVVMTEESDVFMSYHRLIRRHEAVLREDQQELKRQTASFVTMFRVLQPELWDYFESEEVPVSQWIPSWFKSLLSRQLPLSCVLRLWDTYFSSDEGLELHPFVCLAIMDLIQEEIFELDGADIVSYLHSLPHLDIDRVVALASNIREDAVGREIL